MKHFTLSALMMMAMCSMSGIVTAQEATPVQSGYCSGIFYAFYFGERDIDRAPIAYQKYSDGTIVLPGFANGQDLTVKMGELDEYNTYVAVIDDCEGVGAHDTYTFSGYEYYPFDVYRFTQPVDLVGDQIEFLFMDGTTYYDPASDTLVLDYISAVDAEEYMLLIDFTLPYEGDIPTGIDQLTLQHTRPAYDLNGRRADSLQKGLRIVDGKKVFRQ